MEKVDDYYEKIKLVANELKPERARIQTRMKILITVLVFLFLVTIGVAIDQDAYFIIWFAFFIGIILYFVFFNLLTKGYKKQYKTKVISALVQELNENFTYDVDKHISQKVFEVSKLFSQHRVNRYKGEDFIQGKVGNSKFQCSMVKAEERRRKSTVSFGSSRKKKRNSKNWETIFEGLFYVFNIEQEFNTEIFLQPRHPDGPEGLIGAVIHKITGGNKGEVIETGNSEFDNEFKVMVRDKSKVETIYNPEIQDALLNLKRKVVEKIKIYPHISFIGSNMFMAYSSLPLLKPRIFKGEILEKDDFRECFWKIEIVNEIINIFDDSYSYE